MLGRLRRATAEAERAATSSLAAVSDNPVFVPPCEGHPLGATLSNGSYHNAQAPQAMDGLGMAWADLCQLLERQTERLLTDPTVFGEGHVPVKILYMVQTWWAEEARAAAQPTLIPLGGYGQNDTCAPSFFAWRRQEQVGRCLDAAMAIVAAISSQAMADADREPPPALAELLADVRARFPVVTEAHPLGEEAGRLAAWFTDARAWHERAVRTQHRRRRGRRCPLDRHPGHGRARPRSRATTTSCRPPTRLPALGIAPVRSLYLGELDGVPCRSAELPDDTEPPEGMAFRTLRDLYGRVDEHLWTLAGRAAQLVEWDRTHLHCGRCGTPTEHAPGERARRCPSAATRRSRASRRP